MRFLLPPDCLVAEEFDETADTQFVDADKIPAGWMGVDIGPKSVELFKEEIANAKTIVWNGPMGVFEKEPFAHGTPASHWESLMVTGTPQSGPAVPFESALSACLALRRARSYSLTAMGFNASATCSVRSMTDSMSSSADICRRRRPAERAIAEAVASISRVE